MSLRRPKVQITDPSLAVVELRRGCHESAHALFETLSTISETALVQEQIRTYVLQHSKRLKLDDELLGKLMSTMEAHEIGKAYELLTAFHKNEQLYEGITWDDIESALLRNPDAIRSLMKFETKDAFQKLNSIKERFDINRQVQEEQDAIEIDEDVEDEEIDWGDEGIGWGDGLIWKDVIQALLASSSAIESLINMESAGHEPDIYHNDDDYYYFGTCEAEPPESTWNCAYDNKVLLDIIVEKGLSNTSNNDGDNIVRYEDDEYEDDGFEDIRFDDDGYGVHSHEEDDDEYEHEEYSNVQNQCNSAATAIAQAMGAELMTPEHYGILQEGRGWFDMTGRCYLQTDRQTRSSGLAYIGDSDGVTTERVIVEELPIRRDVFDRSEARYFINSSPSLGCRLTLKLKKIAA